MRRLLALLLCFAWVLPLVTPVPVVAVSLYGAGAYEGADPIGGGEGYTSYYSSDNAYAVVTTASALSTALSGAGEDDIIWIPDGTTITIGSGFSKTLQSGAILASNRGEGGVAGGKIKWTYFASSYMSPLIYAETGSVISGLTFEGPCALSPDSGPRNCAIRIESATRVEIENCEIYNFPEGGIWIGDTAGSFDAWDSDDPVTGRHWIHHCYIHNIQKSGFGYGIGTQGSGNTFLAEANKIGPCRHSIMGQAGYTNYVLRYNIFTDCYYATSSAYPYTSGSGWYNAVVVDCHGSGTTASPPAGNHLLVYYNTFSKNTTFSAKPNVGIRGIPYTECLVYYNWTQKTFGGLTGLRTETVTKSNETAFATLLSSGGYDWPVSGDTLADYNMSVYDNWYGTAAPTDAPPAAYHVTTLSAENVTNDSGVIAGSFTGPFDNQTITNTGFVWDTVSRANPGDVAPDASDYGHSWIYTDDYSANGSVSHTISLVDGETYYFRFGVDWDVGPWEYGEELSLEAEDCEAYTLQDPQHLIATPLNGTTVELSWINPNPQYYSDFCGGGAAFPGLETIIRMRQWDYPTGPETHTAVFEGLAGVDGGHTYTVTGLTPGVTYYFRIWFDDPTEGYTDYDEAFATPYSGLPQPSDVATPSNWFTDPTCDMWGNVPMVGTIVNGIEDKFGTTSGYLCLMINLFCVSCAMVMSYGAMGATTQRWVGTNTILVPFIVLCAAFVIGPMIGAFPGFFLIFGLLIGLGVAFAWSRA